MYLITQRNSHDGIYYEKSFVFEEGEISSKEIVHFRNAKLQYKGIEYVFLYDRKVSVK